MEFHFSNYILKAGVILSENFPKVDYKSYRPKRAIGIELAADVIGKSERQFIRYENGEQIPGDNDVMTLGELYKAPEMIFKHLGYNNPIGRRFQCRPLNQINRTFPAICFKSQEELREMVSAINGMCNMVLNGQDLAKWGMTEEFDRCFQELVDVEQLVLEAKIKYAEIRGLAALEKRYQEHDAKCLAHGYRVAEKKEKQPKLMAAGCN